MKLSRPTPIVMFRLLAAFLSLGVLVSCAPTTESTPREAVPTAPSLLPTPPAITGQSRDLLFENDENITYCEIKNNDLNTYSRTGSDQKLYPLASLSKVITAYWALSVLGPRHQFETQIYLRPIQGAKGAFDLHLSTNFDPIFNREKVLLLMSELHRKGVRQIRQLSIDETSRIYLSALNNPSAEVESIPLPSRESLENLKLIFNSRNWKDNTIQAIQKLNQWTTENRLDFFEPAGFDVESYKIILKKEFNKASYPVQFSLKSAVLLRYIKNMNVFSNNYLADSLFHLLGGAVAFKKFQNEVLKISSSQLQIQTGSGVQVGTGLNRFDNQGSCYSMLRLLAGLRSYLEAQKINLNQVMLNPDQDLQGTFEQGHQIESTVYIKTGRLYEVPTLNVAGWSMVTDGVLQFVFLGHDFSASESEQMEQKRLQMLQDISGSHGVRTVSNTKDDYLILMDVQSLRSLLH